MSNQEVLIHVGPENPHPKKSLWVALVLSIFTPGLGQFYAGRPLRCFAFYLMNFAIMLACSFSGLMDSFSGLVLFLGLTVTWRLYTIADAMLLARRNESPDRRSVKWYALVGIGVGMLLLAAFMPAQLIGNHRTFSIPSTANEPAVYVGEYIVASTEYYEDHTPDYGDLIVYLGNDGLFYTYRVVGLGGDSFRLENDIPVVNQVPNATQYLRDTNLMEGPAEIYLETFPNGKSHQIILAKTKWPDAIVTTDELTIPEGFVYIMGDTRDNALDSRYVGPVSEWQIEGKCLYVYWSRHKGRIGATLEL